MFKLSVTLQAKVTVWSLSKQRAVLYVFHTQSLEVLERFCTKKLLGQLKVRD